MIKYCISIVVILLVICGFIFIVLGFSMGHYLFSAAGSIFAAAGLFYAAHQYTTDKAIKSSSDYLEQIKKYFEKAVMVMKAEDNCHIKWHLGINYIKTALNISKELKFPVHQTIYIMDYISTGYLILSELKKIDNYRFFFGVRNYETKSDKELFEESKFKSLINPGTQISSDSLVHLLVFFDKCAKASFDVNTIGSSYNKVFASLYFNEKSDKSTYEVTGFGGGEILKKYRNKIEELEEASSQK